MPTTAPPCRECDGVCDYQVTHNAQDRVWYCEDCGVRTAEWLNSIGEDKYVPAAYKSDQEDEQERDPQRRLEEYEEVDTEELFDVDEVQLSLEDFVEE